MIQPKKFEWYLPINNYQKRKATSINVLSIVKTWNNDYIKWIIIFGGD